MALSVSLSLSLFLKQKYWFCVYMKTELYQIIEVNCMNHISSTYVIWFKKKNLI